MLLVGALSLVVLACAVLCCPVLSFLPRTFSPRICVRASRQKRPAKQRALSHSQVRWDDLRACARVVHYSSTNVPRVLFFGWFACACCAPRLRWYVSTSPVWTTSENNKWKAHFSRTSRVGRPLAIRHPPCVVLAFVLAFALAFVLAFSFACESAVPRTKVGRVPKYSIVNQDGSARLLQTMLVAFMASVSRDSSSLIRGPAFDIRHLSYLRCKAEVGGWERGKLRVESWEPLRTARCTVESCRQLSSQYWTICAAVDGVERMNECGLDPDCRHGIALGWKKGVYHTWGSN